LADAQSKKLAANLHVGTMGWSYNFWKGVFYPEKLPSKQFLHYYASKLNSVEVDSTFYRMPQETTITEWKNQTPEDFVFSLKFPQAITHVKMLKDCQRETEIFLERTFFTSAGKATEKPSTERWAKRKSTEQSASKRGPKN
jgi:uncharacterized protein YecE (DUF72 family)